MSNVCVDSGFLIGLYDDRDDFHQRALTYFTEYFAKPQNRLLVPWPSLYESVTSQMAKGKKGRTKVQNLDRDWKTLRTHDQLTLLDDQPFREQAMEECFAELDRPPQHYRGLSLADRVIRRILADAKSKVDIFITFDPGDFGDVCKQFGRQMLP